MGKKIVCFGEVLWDDFGVTKTIGGAPLNVCYHLSKLNRQPIIVSQVGQDALGVKLISHIANWGIDTRFCLQTQTYPTSTVVVNLLPEGEVKYDITEAVAWDYLTYNDTLAGEIADSDAFVYGTLAARNQMTRNVLLEYLKVCNWPILDLNLRQPYCEPEVIMPLIRACKSIKINLEELYFLCRLCKGSCSSENEGVSLVLSAFDNLDEVILTKGGEGASYYNRDVSVNVRGVKIQVQDTVGSGDSFLAAFINGKLSGKGNKEVLQEAAILSAYIATRNGGCPPYTLTDLENFKSSLI